MQPLHSPLAEPRSARRTFLLSLGGFMLALSATVLAGAADVPQPGSVVPPARSAATMAVAAVWEKIGLPHYQVPTSYSEDLVITAADQSFTLKRAIDGQRTRTELSADGKRMVMIELGDERGTTYQLMPDRKEALKQSREAMDQMVGGRLGRAEAQQAAEPQRPAGPPTDVRVEDLGDDTVGSEPARKLRLTSSDGVVLAWFEKASGAPLRMESTASGKLAVVEWKNRQAAPQAPALFEVPRGYQVQDFDEMVAKMKSMGGMPGMGQGMMSGMGQGMGSSMGASLGASLGGSLGGPLGGLAGQYIGGRVGGMIGKKAGDLAP